MAHLNKKITKDVLLNNKLYERLFIGSILSSFFLWILFIIIEGDNSKQWNLFFLNCNDFIADFLNANGYCGQRDPYNNTVYTSVGEKGYPPFPYIFHYMFSRLVDVDYFNKLGYFKTMYYLPKVMMFYMLITIITIVVMYELIRNYMDGTTLVKSLTGISVLCSWPVLYSVERGNTIIVAAIFLMFFVFFYNSNNPVLREIAFVSLALSASIKMTPAIFGVVLLYEKRWKEALRTIIYGLLLFLLPFLFFKGGMKNLLLMFRNINYNLSIYSEERGCTLLGGLLYYSIPYNELSVMLSKSLTYVLCILLLFSFPLQKRFFDKIIFVSLILLILPSHSGYYCLLYLIPAMIVFLNEKKKYYSDIIVLIGFLMIMIPFQSDVGYVFFNYHIGILLISIVSVIRSVEGIKTYDKFLRNKIQ